MSRAQLESLIANRTPLIDVRAPVEFERGHFPAADNLPLLNDDERHQVGLAYRQGGTEAARARGHELVHGDERERRIARWLRIAERHPDAQVCCWRGGERSAIACQWMLQAGREISRVPGGFKAMRRVAMEVLATPAPRRWVIVAGRTGAGKTAVLAGHPSFIDLEGAAHHRGSAFGGHGEPQPSQVSFENRLASDWLGVDGNLVVVEDESRNIGGCVVPESWVQHIRGGELVVLEAGREQRAAHIEREYVLDPLSRGRPAGELSERYHQALKMLRRRLGDERWRAIGDLMTRAFRADPTAGHHRAWIAELLRHYYDPMYDHQLAKHPRTIACRGDAAEVGEYLRSLARAA